MKLVLISGFSPFARKLWDEMYLSGRVFMLGVLSLSRAQTLRAQDLSDVSLTQLAHGGSGCPQGALKFAELITPWRFMAIIDGFTAGVGSNPCYRQPQSLPDKHQYQLPRESSVHSLYFTGSSPLPNPEGEDQIAEARKDGNAQKSFSDILQGTLNEKFAVYKLTHLKTADLWSPCGAPSPINVVNELSVTQTGTESLYDSGVIDFTFLWRSC
ncbi:hypothetical protein BDZ45DRAFT_746172 [Acephala macrosclerotiorum]|nr:hypothetical protein BDZ45DRAFT_746172 [Acephala macrosclerotiorum]